MSLHISTVALSAYNVIAQGGGESPIVSVTSVTAGALGMITTDDVLMALAELENRRLITINTATKSVDLRGNPDRAIVRWRDRTGDGWQNWTIKTRQGARYLKEVI